MGWARRHWQGIAGAGALLLSVWQVVRSMISDVDFVAAHVQNPGWIGTVLAFLSAPPPYIPLLLVVVGLGLIFWQVRRSPVSARLGSVATSAPRMPMVSRVTKKAAQNEFAGMTKASARQWLENAALELKAKVRNLPTSRVRDGRQGKHPVPRGVDVYLPYWHEGERLAIGIRNDDKALPPYLYIATKPAELGSLEVMEQFSNAADGLAKFQFLLARYDTWQPEKYGTLSASAVTEDD